jgi:hypothetical protein
MNYTKGTWQVSPNRIKHIHTNNKDIATVHGPSNEIIPAEFIANVYLITSAPDLYEALKITKRFLDALKKIYPNLWNNADVVMLESTIDSALQKATGEPPKQGQIGSRKGKDAKARASR